MQNLGQNLEVIQKFLTSQYTQKYMKRFQERNHINLQNKDLKQLVTFILMRILLPNHQSLQLVTTLYIYKLMTQLIKEMMMKERFTFIIFLEKIKKIKTGWIKRRKGTNKKTHKLSEVNVMANSLESKDKKSLILV